MTGGWVRGHFEGAYTGTPSTPAASADGRRYRIQLEGGALHTVAIVAEPDAAADRPADLLRQPVLCHVQLPPLQGPSQPDATLYDVRLWDLTLRSPLQGPRGVHGRVSGQLLARLSPPPRAHHEPSAAVVSSSLGPAPPGSAAQRTATATARPVTDAAPAPRSAEPEPAPDPADPTPDEPFVEPDQVDPVWYVLMLLVAWVGLSLGLVCGPMAAALWALALGVAIVVRRGTARLKTRYVSLERGLGAVLVLAQIAVLVGPLDLAYREGCIPELGYRLLWVAGMLVFAGALRARLPLVATCLVWTGVMFTWCGSPAGNCRAPTASTRAARLGTPQTAPRLGADGRWPRRPAGSGPSASGAGSPSQTPGAPPGSEGPRVAPAGAGAAPNIGGAAGAVPGGVDGSPAVPGAQGSQFRGTEPDAEPEPGAGPAADGSPVPAPAGARPPAEVAEPTAPAAPAAPAQAGDPSASAQGWVAPASDTAAPRETGRMSLEQANRNPDAFFADARRRAVYVPTDGLFAGAGEQLTDAAAFELSRLAALLRARPQQRVRLEVHTDGAGEPGALQLLSERRAAAIAEWLRGPGHARPGQVDSVGVGGTRPIVPPDLSPAGQAPNRRLELRLVD